MGINRTYRPIGGRIDLQGSAIEDYAAIAQGTRAGDGAEFQGGTAGDIESRIGNAVGGAAQRVGELQRAAIDVHRRVAEVDRPRELIGAGYAWSLCKGAGKRQD